MPGVLLVAACTAAVAFTIRLLVLRRRLTGLEPRAVAVSPHYQTNSLQEQPAAAPDSPRGEYFSSPAALPASAEEDGGESGLSAAQWERIREEARRSAAGSQHNSPRASNAGYRGPGSQPGIGSSAGMVLHPGSGARQSANGSMPASEGPASHPLGSSSRLTGDAPPSRPGSHLGPSTAGAQGSGQP